MATSDSAPTGTLLSARAVFISPNGAGTSLVRSQVLPYLRGLAALGARIALVTFERGDPYPSGEFPSEQWTGVRAGRGRGLLTKIGDIVRGSIAVLRVARGSRADILHARSYLPAAIAAVVGAVLRRPFIFDMRGFLGEEYVEAGSWTASDVRYLALKFAEGRLLRASAGIVVLTARAAAILRSEPRYRRYVRGRPIVVIPCAVDLGRFRPPATPPTRPVLVYAGSLGMWYLLDEMLRVFDLARRSEPRLRFLVLNRGEEERVRAAVARLGISADGVETRGVPFDQMPAALAEATVGIALIRQGPSKLGSSPIKVAEYLACGLPVLVNRGLGDTDEQVERYGAGHVVETFDDAGLERAAAALLRLLGDAQARLSARRLAEAEYGVEAAVASYARLYADVLRSHS